MKLGPLALSPSFPHLIALEAGVFQRRLKPLEPEGISSSASNICEGGSTHLKIFSSAVLA